MLDNVLTLCMAQDATRVGRSRDMFVKLDFEKAYNKAEHAYLWSTIESCEFGDHFVRLVKRLTLCASTVVHLNGAETFRFTVRRDVRLGCPLVPLLFVLATQPLMTETKHNYEIGRMKGFGVPGLLTFRG